MIMALANLMSEEYNTDDELLKAVDELDAELNMELTEALKGFIHGLLMCFCGAIFMVPMPDFVKRSKHKAGHMAIPIIFYSLGFIVCFSSGLSCIFQSLKLRIHHTKKRKDIITLVAAMEVLMAGMEEEEDEVKEYKAIKTRVEELKAKHHRDKEYFEDFRGLVCYLSSGLLTWLGGSFFVVALLKEDDMAGVFTITGYVLGSIGCFSLGVACLFKSLKIYLNFWSQTKEGSKFFLCQGEDMLM